MNNTTSDVNYKNKNISITPKSDAFKLIIENLIKERADLE